MARIVAISYFMSEYSSLCGIQVSWSEYNLLWITLSISLLLP